MNEIKHTPGEIEADDFICNDGPHGEAIYLRSKVRHWAVCKVMSMTGCSDPTKDVSADEMKANAARIALAWNCHDDLVAALQEALAALNGASNTTGLHEQINAALAKARA